MPFLAGIPYFSTLDAKLLGFEQIKDLYPLDQDISDLYLACEKVAFGD